MTRLSALGAAMVATAAAAVPGLPYPGAWPMVLTGESGGWVHLEGDCSGWFPARPRVVRPTFGRTRLGFVADGDVVVLVRGAGVERCLVDGKATHTDLPADATVEVFVGSQSEGAAHPYALGFFRWDLDPGRDFFDQAMRRASLETREAWANTRPLGAEPIAFDSHGGRFRMVLTGLAPHPGVPVRPQHRIRIDRDVETRVKVVARLGIAAIARQHCPGGAAVSQPLSDDAETALVLVNAPGCTNIVDFYLAATNATADQPYSLQLSQPSPHGVSQQIWFPIPAASEPGGSGSFRSASRALAVRPIVRLLRRGRPHCTATLVRRGGENGLLTAAHCLFEATAAGRLVPMRAALLAEGLGPLDVSRAQLGLGFRACVAQRLAYGACVASSAADVAFVPYDPRLPRDVTPWTFCEEPLVAGAVTAFGYGLTERGLPAELGRATFDVSAGTVPGLSRAVGRWGSVVDRGDSGGPVIGADADVVLSTRTPCVGFVVVARQRAVSWLQPAMRAFDDVKLSR